MSDDRSPAQTALDTLLTGLRDQAKPDELETWKNATRGSIVLRRFSESGHLIEQMITGGRTVQMTPRERRINSEAAANVRLNPFANGTMQPVKLIDGEADTAEIASNPNVMGETEVAGLFKAHWKTFAARVETIDNTMLLNRMLEVAKDDSTGATVKQLEVIKARLATVSGEPIFDEVVSTGRAVGDNAGGARTI